MSRLCYDRQHVHICVDVKDGQSRQLDMLCELLDHTFKETCEMTYLIIDRLDESPDRHQKHLGKRMLGFLLRILKF